MEKWVAVWVKCYYSLALDFFKKFKKCSCWQLSFSKLQWDVIFRSSFWSEKSGSWKDYVWEEVSHSCYRRWRYVVGSFVEKSGHSPIYWKFMNSFNFQTLPASRGESFRHLSRPPSRKNTSKKQGTREYNHICLTDIASPKIKTLKGNQKKGLSRSTKCFRQKPTHGKNETNANTLFNDPKCHHQDHDLV